MSEENDQNQPEQTDFQKYEDLPEAERDAAIESTRVEEEPAKSAVAKPVEAKPAVAEPAKPAEHEDDEDAEVPKGLRKRFRELTTEIRELKAKQAAAPAAEPAKPAVAAGPREGEPAEPQLNDFATFAEYDVAQKKYVKDLVRFEAHQVATEGQRATAQAAAAEAQQTAKAKWKEAQDAIREEKDDFDEVALNPKLPVTQVMFDVMQEGNHSAELLYHLGQDAKDGGDISAKIAAMTPAAQARAIARLEAKLFPETEEAEVKKPAVAAVSKAPRPPKLVSGASGADLGKEPDPKDFKAWNKWKDRQEAAEQAA